MSEQATQPIETPPPDAPALTYGLARPRPWWRRRWAIALIVLMPVAGWVFVNRDDLSLRVRRAYWSRRCASFVIPPGTTLVETDSKRITDLANRSNDYVFTIRDGKVLAATFWPRSLREFAAIDTRPFQLRGSPYSGLVLNSAYAPITFLHERTSPGGKRYLVIVSGSWTNALDLDKHTDSLVIPMPSFTDSLVPPVRTQKAFQYSGRHVKADLHPGVADPADASHFMIPCDAEGQRHTLHGYLQDDGTIKFNKQ